MSIKRVFFNLLFSLLLPCTLSQTDIRNRLQNDNTRLLCYCSEALLKSTMVGMDVKGKWYLVEDLVDFHPCMTASLFGPDRFRTECRQHNSLDNITIVMMSGLMSPVVIHQSIWTSCHPPIQLVPKALSTRRRGSQISCIAPGCSTRTCGEGL